MSAPVANGLQFSICAEKNWSERGDLNSRPPVPQTGALTELRYAPKPNSGLSWIYTVRLSKQAITGRERSIPWPE
jgi:hypothetical protein